MTPAVVPVPGPVRADDRARHGHRPPRHDAGRPGWKTITGAPRMVVRRMTCRTWSRAARTSASAGSRSCRRGPRVIPLRHGAVDAGTCAEGGGRRGGERRDLPGGRGRDPGVPDRVVGWFGGPNGGVARYGGLVQRYRPPDGYDAAKFRQSTARRGATVRYNGALLVVEAPGVRSGSGSPGAREAATGMVRSSRSTWSCRPRTPRPPATRSGRCIRSFLSSGYSVESSWASICLTPRSHSSSFCAGRRCRA